MIYNAAPMLSYPALEPFNDIKMKAVTVDEIEIVPEYIEANIKDLPTALTWINIEPNSEKRQLFKYDPDNPEVAVDLYNQIADVINRVRPDWTWGFAPMPHSPGAAYYNPKKYAQLMVAREIAFAEIRSPVCFSQSYWRADPSDLSFLPHWKAMIDHRLSMAQFYHKKPVYPYVWHRSIHPDYNKQLLSWEVWSAVMNHLKGRDKVFWAWPDDEIPWSIRLDLWRRG